MKIVPDSEAARRIEDFEPLGHNFDWDEGNEKKNLKHGVSDDDIESIFKGFFFFAGQITEPKHREWRGLILGRDLNGRCLALIFTARENKLHRISCRSMRSEERRKYEEEARERRD